MENGGLRGVKFSSRIDRLGYRDFFLSSPFGLAVSQSSTGNAPGKGSVRPLQVPESKEQQAFFRYDDAHGAVVKLSDLANIRAGRQVGFVQILIPVDEHILRVTSNDPRVHRLLKRTRELEEIVAEKIRIN